LWEKPSAIGCAHLIRIVYRRAILYGVTPGSENIKKLNRKKHIKLELLHIFFQFKFHMKEV
jgi:hypothetical protein